MKKKTINIIVFTLAGILIAYFLVAQIKVEELLSLFKNLSLKWVFFAYLVYLCTYILRSIRWCFLLRESHIQSVLLFFITSIHTMFNNLLPARTGELSFIVLLKKWKNVPSTKGMASLFLARISDIAVMSVFFLISVFVLWGQLQVPVIKLVLLTIIAVPLLLLVLMGIVSRRGIHHFSKFIKNSALKRFSFIIKILGKLEEISHTIHEIKMSKEFFFSLIFSFLIWGVKFYAFFLLIRSFNIGLSLGFWSVVLGTTFSEMTSVLPVNSVAGIGTIEGGWTIGFLLLGIKKELVIVSGFAFHIMLLLFSIITGIASVVLLNLIFKNLLKNKTEN